jgi:cytochrome c6
MIRAMVVVGSILLFVMGAGPLDAADRTGEALFKENCAACHPDGGNIINPRKTLKNKDMVANKVTTEDAIIKLMRSPGPGMLKFDQKTLPDKDARSIAKFILSTFAK